MERMRVNIGGIPTKIITKKIDIDRIILDQDNPRIGLFKDSQIKADLTQEEIEFALINKNPQAFDKLKESIEANGGIINPIWVHPLDSEKFMIIEGNTRLVIYKKLREKYLNKETYQKILCNILPKKISESQINFIKLEAHLRGTTEWDSYEKARYLFILNDIEGYSVRALTKLTKMSEREIRLNIQAFLDMERQYLPKYQKDPTEVFKFSYFVEYEKNRKLKDVMKKQNLTIDDFCDWVSSGKIPRAMLVRDLNPILETTQSRKAFIEKGYETAMEKLSILKPNLTSPLFDNIARVIDGLKNLPSWEISQIIEGEQPHKKELINKLYDQVKKTKKLIERE